MGVKSQLIGFIVMTLSFTSLLIAETSPSTGMPSGISSSEDILSGGNRERDSLVLVDFYTQSRGTSWYLKWDLTTPISQWMGISLDSTGCVSCIDLDGQGGCTISVGGGNGLSGVITPRIGELQGLKHLLLGNNRLSGNIPESLFEIPNIMTVDVFANEMIGPLPASVGKAANLMTLSLAGNNLDGQLPPEINGLVNLKDLLIDNNRFSGPIPKELGDVINLNRIRFNNNDFTGPLPAEIGKLIELTSINIAENQLSGMIPPEIGNLTKLQDLILANNNLEEFIPHEIGNLIELKRLRLCHNKLIGPLPSQIGQLINMEEFWANDNNLEGQIPTEIGNCTDLSDLRLDENLLTGTIPNEVTELENLRRFNVSFNKLTGPLPATLKKLTKLQELHISDNQLTGPLPARLDYLLSVKIIRAENNQFIGPLPSSIAILERLKEFNLANNNIDGAIPSAYGEVATLNNLDLSNNKLSGCFPESLHSKCGEAFVFLGNTELPWLGQFDVFCLGDEQIGAKCSTETGVTAETIQEDCECYGHSCNPHNVVQDTYLCDSETITIGGTVYGDSGQIVENLLNVGGCDSIVTHNIIRLQVDIMTENTSCEGSSEGSVFVDISVGGLFDYRIFNTYNDIIAEGQQVTAIPSFENVLEVGEYYIVISENNLECNISKRFTISSDAEQLPETNIEEIKCEGESILINGTTYDANNQSGTERMKSVKGCDSLVNVSLTYLDLEIITEDVSCGGNTDGKVTCITNVELEDAVYLLLDENGTELNTTNNDSFDSQNSLAPGKYTLVLSSDQLGCNYEKTIEIKSLNAIPDESTNEYELCPGEIIEMNGIVYSESNPTGTETFTSAYGCDSIVHISLSYIEMPTATDDVFISNEDNTFDVIANDYYSQNASYTVNVIDYEYIDNITIDNRNRVVVEIDENYSGKSFFTYEICATDCSQDCVTAKATITSQGDGYDEDILTPNQDGHNDVLVVTGYSEYETISNSRINIINRWGQVVYSVENYSNDWTGNLNGNSSKPLPEGVYYYHLIFTNGKSIMGSRSLIR